MRSAFHLGQLIEKTYRLLVLSDSSLLLLNHTDLLLNFRRLVLILQPEGLIISIPPWVSLHKIRFIAPYHLLVLLAAC